MWNSAENLSVRSTSFREDGDDEEALRWAALERLPTYARVRRGIFRNIVGDVKEIDVDKLENEERKVLLGRLFDSVDDDWERFFNRMRRRFESFRDIYKESTPGRKGVTEHERNQKRTRRPPHGRDGGCDLHRGQAAGHATSRPRSQP